MYYPKTEPAIPGQLSEPKTFVKHLYAYDHNPSYPDVKYYSGTQTKQFQPHPESLVNKNRLFDGLGLPTQNIEDDGKLSLNLLAKGFKNDKNELHGAMIDKITTHLKSLEHKRSQLEY